MRSQEAGPGLCICMGGFALVLNFKLLEGRAGSALFTAAPAEPGTEPGKCL